MSAQQRLEEANGRLATLFKADQKTMSAFGALTKAAVRDGSIGSAMKELIATAIAVARGCDDCIVYHVAEAKKHGASRESLVEVLAIAVEMSGGPGAVYAAKALTAFDEL